MDGKTIEDLPSSNGIQDVDVFELQNPGQGSFKTSALILSEYVNNKYSLPVANNVSIGGIKTSDIEGSLTIDVGTSVAMVNGFINLKTRVDNIGVIQNQDIDGLF